MIQVRNLKEAKSQIKMDGLPERPASKRTYMHKSSFSLTYDDE